MYWGMALVFILGYLCIAFEHTLKIDKSASALLTAVLVWTLLIPHNCRWLILIFGNGFPFSM